MKTLTVQDLAMYLNCDCQITSSKIPDMRNKWFSSVGDTVKIEPVLLLTIIQGFMEVKPILRPLSDMTEGEKFELQDISGWVDYTHYLKMGLISAPMFKYLTGKGFDLFDWIEQGLAISSILNPPIGKE
jgi:hypothetical protein